MCPLPQEILQRIVQRCRIGMVILSGHKNEGISFVDLSTPPLGVIKFILLETGVVRLLHNRQIDLSQIENFDIESTMILRFLLVPPGYAVSFSGTAYCICDQC